ncbi:MAG: hypothetical protein AB7L94_09510 [Kofleriaceae bacterium]
MISDKRDLATDKLAAMDPKARAELEDKAATWADQVMDVTQSADRDDSEHADKIASILGPRSPEEIELIRARIRLQSSGVDEKKRTTLHEQLDRTFTGNDKDIALAGLSGNHVNVAARQLVDAAAEGDPERVHRIVKSLDETKLAELRATNPVLLAQIASNMPADQRGHVEAALGGRRGEAEGGRIESLLQPVELSTSDGLDVSKAKRKMAQKEAQDPERLIEELQRMAPADLAEARKTHGERWDQLIAERYEGIDSTLRLRIEAAARGDRNGERALRLRQGMRTYDQRLIDQALANPDLQSEDPEKKAAAEAERRDLEDRMRAYDATDQRTQALADGNAAPADVIGRDTQTQLDAYYARAKDHDTEASGLAVAHVATKHERMERIREKAHVDSYAAGEMLSEGDARASTKVRRAELAGNIEQKAEILESLDKKDTAGSTRTLAAQAAEYSEKFGRDMLAKPDVSSAERMVTLAGGLIDDDRTAHEIAEQLAREDMSDGELRMAHVRETGVLADRTRGQRAAQMRERADNSHSGWLAGSEMLNHMRGGNRGSEDRLESAVLLMERGNVEGVDDREQARRDKSATSALALQREEKQREAAKIAQVISIAAKIAAILTANPALFVAVDAGFTALRIAAQEMIANEAFEIAPELEHMAVDVVVNMATARFAGMGKGVQAGTQAAKGVQIVQRIGMGAAAVGGAAAHSALDGEGGGAAIFQTVLGVTGLGNYARGKLEGLFKGSGRLSRLGRAVGGTFGEAGVNIGVSGGHVDMNTLLDAGGNTVQDRMHGHAPRKATHDDYERVTRSSHIDYDAPRRSDEDSLRRSPARRTDTRENDLDAHTREVERRRANEQARAQAHYADDDGPSYASTSPLHSAGANDGYVHDGAGESNRRRAPANTHSNASSNKATRDDGSDVGANLTASRPEEFRGKLGARAQERANNERTEKLASSQAEFAEIDRLAGLATTKSDWEYIRKLEHEAERPVSERYSPHDEIAALQQYERGGGLTHPDGTPMTADEAKLWIAKTRGEFQPSVDERTREHHAAVASLKRELDERIAQRDRAKTSELAAKVETAPLDDNGRRVVTVDEAISLGMGGAGATGAKQGRTHRPEVVTRADRLGIEDATKPELWGTLGTKPAGQEADAISYGTTGARTPDIAEHATAQVAKASELALQVAAQRDQSEVGTIGSQGPIGELVIKRIDGPDGPVLEVGVPVTMKVGDQLETVVVTTTKGVDIASGMGPARQLATEATASARQPQQIDSGYASTLKQSGVLMSGEQALAHDPSHFAGKRVLGIGGGPTSVWAGEHASAGGAAHVEIVGAAPKPPPGSTQGKELAAVEAEIRTLVTTGKEVPARLTERHHAITEAHLQTQLKRLDELTTTLKGDIDPLARERALAEQAAIKGNIDPFIGARVDRNHATLNDGNIQHSQADVMLVRPSADGAVEVVFSDGTRTIVDQVIPSIGPDPNEPGGINSMLKAMPQGIDLVPVIVEGRVVGLESDPPGVTISGASLTGTAGVNMPEALLRRIPAGMRDAVVSNLIDHANRKPVLGTDGNVIRKGVSDGSKGIVPGIENVGDAPELMQQALAERRTSRDASREAFLENHLKARAEFRGEPRFSDQQLKIDSQSDGSRRGTR